mmetsp:Transcript_138202/g.240464  ORF Transcript_138202/g.240464 Transcript_138202/m.240464 type:complete len:271 (-) Transcript_138202:116-928(-)
MLPKWRVSLTTVLLHLFLLAPRSLAQRAWGLALRGSAEDNWQPSVSFGGAGLPVPETSVGRTTYGSKDSLDITRQGKTEVSLSSSGASFPNIAARGDVSVAEFAVKGVPQWRLWDLDTFDTIDSNQWTPLNDRGFCGASDDKFLGGHCRLGAVTVRRKYAELPLHKRVRVSARLHFIDEWKGESLSLLVGDQPVWSKSHHWCPYYFVEKCKKYGLDTCGRETPDRLSVKVEASFDHSTPMLDIAFNSSLALGTDACLVSWGVDDVSVELV